MTNAETELKALMLAGQKVTRPRIACCLSG